MAILSYRDKDGNIKEIPALRGEKGNPGVYVGSGDMPEDCNVQIDPNGDVFTLDDITVDQVKIPIINAEYEVGFIDSNMNYTTNDFYIRTKQGYSYKVPAGTTFALNKYTDTVDGTTKNYTLVARYSADNSIFVSESRTKANPDLPITIPYDAYVAIVIGNEDRQTANTVASITNLLDIDVPTVADCITKANGWGVGKKIVNIGDSIFGNYDNQSISTYLAEFSGASVYNCALGGTSVQTEDELFKPFCFGNIAAAIQNNDFTWQKNQVANLDVNDDTKYIYTTHLNTLDSIDFNSIDVLTISYGTNDWLDGKNNLNTIISVLESGIKKINVKYPHMKIVLISPIWRFINGKNSDTTSYGNGTLETFSKEYRNLALKLKISFFDAYHSLMFNEDSCKTFYKEEEEYNDEGVYRYTHYTHLNEVGNKLYAEVLNGYLQTVGGTPISPTQTRNPMVTFVDDDGYAEAIENWVAIANETGVKPTIAVVTSTVEETQGALKSNFEFEIGTVSYSDGNFSYTDNAWMIRTKENQTYEIPEGTEISLSSYAGGRTLVIYYSYDNGETFTSFSGVADGDKFVAQQNAVIVLKMYCNANQTDTSLTKLLTFNSDKVSWSRMIALQNRGFEFISHTHTHLRLTDIEESAIRAELENSQAAFNKHGMKAEFLAYPENAYSRDVMEIVKEYFKGAVAGNSTENYPPLTTFGLHRQSVNTTLSTSPLAYGYKELGDLTAIIDTVVKNNGWVIFMTHIRNQGGFYYDDIVKKLLIDLIKYAGKAGCELVTLGEGFEKYKNRLDCGHYNWGGNTHGWNIVDCDGKIYKKEVV